MSWYSPVPFWPFPVNLANTWYSSEKQTHLLCSPQLAPPKRLPPDTTSGVCARHQHTSKAATAPQRAVTFQISSHSIGPVLHTMTCTPSVARPVSQSVWGHTHSNHGPTKTGGYTQSIHGISVEHLAIVPKGGLCPWALQGTFNIRSDQISRSVVSDFLQPHESQHARPPCPSPIPGVH